MTRSRWRLALRMGLRTLGIEDVLMSAPTYLFKVTKK
jgi:hypothetical protein